MTLRIEVNDEAFQKMYNAFGAGGLKLLDEEGEATAIEASEYLERQVVLGEPELRGNLKQGTVASTEQGPSHVWTGLVGVQGEAAKYVWPVELGARPHWPPMNAMEDYVRYKGFSWTDKKGKPMSVKSMAFLIGRAISLRGTIKRFGASPGSPGGNGVGGAQMAANAAAQGAGVVQQIFNKHAVLLEQKLAKLLGGGP